MASFRADPATEAHAAGIVIPGPRPLADLAREAFDATEAAMAAMIEDGIGKVALLKAIDWCYAPQGGLAGSRLEWLKTPPKRHSPSIASASRAETPKVQSVMAEPTSRSTKAAVPQPSLLSSLLALFNGKK